MYDIERLLINVLVLNFFLLFVPLFLIRIFKIKTKYKSEIVFSISVCLAIILCMSLTTNSSEEYALGFHGVAFIIGSLYSGLVTSLGLWLVILISQGLIEGYRDIVVSVVMLMLVLICIPITNRINKNTKLLLGGILSAASSIIIILNYYYIQHIDIKPFIALGFITLSIISTFIIMYVLEIVKETNYVNKKLIKAEKMEVVSYLAPSISHEVRNPLTVVKGFLQMMKQTDISEVKKIEFIDISLKEVERANDIIVSYLTFAKPSSKKLVPIDIKQELIKVMDIITPLANMNCVEVNSKIESSFIKGDSELFQQCFLNIIKNCIEAMPNCGVLHINTSKKDGQLIIQISDTGIGMTNEQLSRLGEPYFSTKGNEGTGLGMMVVKRIIEILNGELFVTSRLNKGTYFKITFPLVEMDVRINA